MSICTPSIRRALRTALVISGVAMASCQSARPAYLFQPSASGAATAVAPARIIALPEPTTLTTMRAVPTMEVARRQGQQEAKTRVRAHSASARLVRRGAVPHTLVAWQRTIRPAAQATQKVARPRHAKEVGLGTTVLGVLGLVVLPISLIGLLIWGGPVWAILAGLAALAVLVAYLDPFG